MSETPSFFTVHGKAEDHNGHGALTWSVDCSDLAFGRSLDYEPQPFTGRMMLAIEIMPALQSSATLGLARSSFKSGISHLKSFWRFLDEMEEVSRSKSVGFVSPNTVLDVPGPIWTLYTNWLDAQNNERQHFCYFHVKRLFSEAASLIAPGALATHGYPLPPNPYENVQVAAARSGRKQDQLIEPETARKAAKSLFNRIKRTSERIVSGRRQLAVTDEGLPSSMELLRRLGQNTTWKFTGIDHETKITLRAGIATALGRHGLSDLIARAYSLVPSQEDLIPALCLVMLRTGWNKSTALDMIADNWIRPHPRYPGRIVEIHSRKARSKGAVQTSYCSANDPEQPAGIIKAVLEWNRPLRESLRDREAWIKERLRSEPMSVTSNKLLEAEQSRIKALINRVWIYLDPKGNIAASSADMRYDVVNKLFLSEQINHKGAALKFHQSLTRNTWAMFAYTTSGYNLVVTQMALNHANLGSLMHYLYRKAIRNQGRRQFYELQTHVIDEITKGRLVPRILRTLVEKGKITEMEAKNIASTRYRTREGMACAAPHAPDAGIDPGHRFGDLCRNQNCLSGCSKAYATLDTLEYMVERVLQLRRLRQEMPLLAWSTSDYPHDLQFLEDLVARFSEANQSKAFDKAQTLPSPLLYTKPSKASLNQALKG